jgi:predicted TIM-barrel enzyme
MTDTSTLEKVKAAIPDTPVFANTGVRVSNAKEQLAIADGAITATTFKRDGDFYNEVDIKRVKEFMNVVKTIRA